MQAHEIAGVAVLQVSSARPSRAAKASCSESEAVRSSTSRAATTSNPRGARRTATSGSTSASRNNLTTARGLAGCRFWRDAQAEPSGLLLCPSWVAAERRHDPLGLVGSPQSRRPPPPGGRGSTPGRCTPQPGSGRGTPLPGRPPSPRLHRLHDLPHGQPRACHARPAADGARRAHNVRVFSPIVDRCGVRRRHRFPFALWGLVYATGQASGGAELRLVAQEQGAGEHLNRRATAPTRRLYRVASLF
jgi:hypothetical protein